MIAMGFYSIPTSVWTRWALEVRDSGHVVMTVALVVIIYIVFCILTGLCGSQRRMGFFGTFIMSLFITPIVMLIVLKLTAPSERVEWRQRPQSD